MADNSLARKRLIRAVVATVILVPVGLLAFVLIVGYLTETFVQEMERTQESYFSNIKTCESLSPHIIKLSEENPTSSDPKILKFYNIQESEQKEANHVLACTAEAKTNRGENSNIKFHLEKDRDGQYFYGYEWQ